MNKKVLSCAAHRMRRANWIRLNAKMAKYTVIAEYTVQAEVEIEAPSLDTAIAVVQVNPGDDVRRSVMLTHSWRVNRVETVDRNGWEGWWIDKVSIDNFNPGELHMQGAGTICSSTTAAQAHRGSAKRSFQTANNGGGPLSPVHLHRPHHRLYQHR